jgi:hypothetical protein
MERITTALIGLLLFAGICNAQVPATIANFRYDSPNVAFDGTEGNSAQEQQNGYITRINLNGVRTQVIATCTGATKPWVCEIGNVPFLIGHNVLYVTIQRNTPCTPPEGATPDYCNESGPSNPLTVFHAVNQREVITNTQTQLTLQCQEGSYAVTRITDATKLASIINAIKRPAVVSNILATQNAIYFFTCIPVSQ